MNKFITVSSTFSRKILHIIYISHLLEIIHLFCLILFSCVSFHVLYFWTEEENPTIIHETELLSFHDYISSYHAVKEVYLLVYFIIRQPTSEVFPKDAYDRSEHTLEFSLAASSESYVSNLRCNGPPPWFCYKYNLSPLVCYLIFSSIK